MKKNMEENMEEVDKKAVIEAILFAVGREVKIKELMTALEVSQEEVFELVQELKDELTKAHRGVDVIRIDDAFTLCTRPQYYEYIYPIIDRRAKPNLSQAALETLAIIAYNPKVTKAEVEAIRGVNSDGTMYKLLEYDLIKSAGKLDAPGKPMTYEVSEAFYKMFGIGTLDELPELPRYKLDENKQIVIDDLLDKEEEHTENE